MKKLLVLGKTRKLNRVSSPVTWAYSEQTCFIFNY
jgi:hypothetical protein